MVANERDDFDPRYSRYPMTFSDVLAALFRPRTKRMQAAAEACALDGRSGDAGCIDPAGMERLGARTPMNDGAEAQKLSSLDTTNAA